MKPASKMTREEFLEAYLPEDHTEHDVAYLKARWAWTISQDPTGELFAEASRLHKFTTFAWKALI